MSRRSAKRPTFPVAIIAPSSYDDEGYVVQWRYPVIPSLALGCVYYSIEHVERLLRRAVASGLPVNRVRDLIWWFHVAHRYVGVHPFRTGVLRRKVRTTRRPGLRREHPFVFYPQRMWEELSTYAAVAVYALRLSRLQRRIERDPEAARYTDAAIAGGDPMHGALAGHGR